MNNRERLLRISQILQERSNEKHSITGREIADLLQKEYGTKASRNTIGGDITTLQKCGMDIAVVRGTQNHYAYVGRIFDQAELKLLIDAVKASRFITRSKSKELVQKIGRLAGPDKDQLARYTEVENRVKNGNKKLFLIIDAIHEAIGHHRQISFKYYRFDARKHKVFLHEGRPYLFNPFFLVWNGEYYYLLGSYGNHPDTVASFRIDRIDEVPEILETKRHPMPKGFNPEQFINGTIHMFGSAEQQAEWVELLCENKTANGIIDRFGLETEMKPCDAEHFRAKVLVVPTSVFYGWVFGFGGRVKILSPEKAIREFREMVEKVGGF